MSRYLCPLEALLQDFMLPLQRLEALGADKKPCLDGLQLLDITVVSLTLSMQPLNISKRLKASRDTAAVSVAATLSVPEHTVPA